MSNATGFLYTKAFKNANRGRRSADRNTVSAAAASSASPASHAMVPATVPAAYPASHSVGSNTWKPSAWFGFR